MYLLALDTSSEQGGVCLLKEGRVLDSISWQSFSNHSAALASNTHQILEKNNLQIKNLAALAVCSGPGSYTGIRIALSFVKGLAALNFIPILSLSSLDLLAYQNQKYQPIAVCLDARNADVYAKFFNQTIDVGAENSEERCLSFKDFFEELESKTDVSKVFWLGSGVLANSDFLRMKKIEEDKILLPENSQFKIESLAALGFECFQKKKKICSAAELEGNYLRNFEIKNKS